MARAPSKATPRGESVLDLGFRKLKIKVSLGAMADVEDDFGCDFSEIEDHLGSTKSIARFIGHLARAAGEEVSDEDIEKIRRCDLDLRELMERIMAVVGGQEQTPGNGSAPSV